MSQNDESQVDNGTSQDDEQGTTGQAPEEQTFDADTVRQLRSEAANYRRKLRELENQVKASEDAKLSDQEKQQKRLTDLEREATERSKQLRDRTLEYEVKLLAATKLKIVDVDAAWRLMDASKIEFDEQNKPVNIETALKELVKAKPYLVQSDPEYSSTNPQRKSGLTMDAIKRMTPAEVNQRWDEVQQVLKSAGGN